MKYYTQFDGKKVQTKTRGNVQYKLETNLNTDIDTYFYHNGIKWVETPETIELFTLFYINKKRGY